MSFASARARVANAADADDDDDDDVWDDANARARAFRANAKAKARARDILIVVRHTLCRVKFVFRSTIAPSRARDDRRRLVAREGGDGRVE